MNDKVVKQDDFEMMRNVEDPSLPAVTHQRYIEAATSENTRRTYRSAIRHFEHWGGLLPADEPMVISYLLDHADSLNPRTLSLRLTALRQWHNLQRFPDPTAGADIRKTLKGIERLHGKPKQKAKVFNLDHLESMIVNLNESDGLKATRDRALLLVGFFGAFRRSELAALDVKDLHWETEGLIITLPRSKTDQTGEGKSRAMPYGDELLCPVSSLRQWLDLSGIDQGRVFRSISRWGALNKNSLNPASVNLILKSVAENACMDFVPEFSSHSLRRSLATNAHRAGASFESIKRQGGWSHDGTVWEYIDEAKIFEDNAVTSLLNKVDRQGK